MTRFGLGLLVITLLTGCGVAKTAVKVPVKATKAVVTTAL